MMDNNSFYKKPVISHFTFKAVKNIGTHPTFQVLVENVINFKAFGVKHKKIVLTDCISSKNNGVVDRFNLLIPYADQMLNWKVLFDQTNPELGPDFEFDDKTFLSDPDLEELENNIPNLVNWNPIDPDCLIKVIMEFVVYYRKHQVDKIQNHELLALEYSTLLKNTEVCEEDVEVILIPDTIDPVEARFFIRITLDFSRLPRRSCNNTDRDAIMLQVTFSNNTWTRIVPLLYLSVSLEELLGNSNTLHLPPFLPSHRLMIYVLDVKKLISDKINSVIENFDKKREFIGTALLLHHCRIIEYDSGDFSFISLLCKYKDFHFFLHIYLSDKFPSDPPKYTLQSCYQNWSNELHKHPVYNVLYSPRWKPFRMLKEAFNYIIKNEVERLKILVSKKKW